MSGNSIREQVLLAAMAVLRPAVEGLGASLHRSPVVALSREQWPALVVVPESEAITERANDRVTRELTVRVAALARAVPPGAPETQADELLTAAHAGPRADDDRRHPRGAGARQPRAGLRVGSGGRRCRRGRHPRALPHHLPNAGQ